MNCIFENLFSWILFVASVISGLCYVYDCKYNLKKRKATVEEARVSLGSGFTKKQEKKLLEPQGVVGQVGSLFYVIVLVFLIRSFLIEPFRIPSGSMMPTLQDGDFIVVNKFKYGIRNPLTNKPLIDISDPKRGDVVVFKYPEDKTVDFIKRVIGLPGDLILYRDKKLYILPKEAEQGARPTLIANILLGEGNSIDGIGRVEPFKTYEEDLLGNKHRMMITDGTPSLEPYFYKQDRMQTAMWKVPEDSYFMMGDNRDNSKDSRFWGFVHKDQLVGEAFGIWLSLDFSRTPDSQRPSWLPSRVIFERIGGLK